MNPALFVSLKFGLLRAILCLVALQLVFGVAFAQEAATDNTEHKWTSLNGKSTIKAKFVRVDGDKVVLTKESGEQITVALEKLSLESQLLAKKLADPSKYQPKVSSSTGSGSKSSSSSGKTSSSTSKTPIIEVASGLSAQQTMDFVLSEIKKGNFEVVASMVHPDDLKSAEELLIAFGKKMPKSSFDMVKKLGQRATGVLKSKKEFVLNHPDFPAEAKEVLEPDYDALVGVLDSLLKSPAADFKMVQSGNVRSMFAHAMRIMGENAETLDKFNKKMLEQTAKNPPPGFDPNAIKGSYELSDLKNASFKLVTEDGTTAEFAVEGSPEAKTVKLEKVGDRWYFAKSPASEQAEQGFQQGLQFIEAMDTKQIQSQILAVNFLAGGVIGGLESANTQEEFNQLIEQLMGGMAGGGRAPGGFPPGGLPPGGLPPGGLPPGGFQPDDK